MAGLVVTGASGLLGRAVLAALRSSDIACGSVEGWAKSRNQDGCLRSVNLASEIDVAAALSESQPTVIVHSAAIRRPDEIKDDVNLAENVNVRATQQLAEYIAATPGGFLLFVSTDYVFDGTAPPYAEDAPVRPLNKYAEQKVAAERIVTATLPEKSAILRVPIMYGSVEYLGEGAVDEVLKTILAAPVDKPLKLDHYHKRNPTHVDDIANALAVIIAKRVQSDNVSGVYQWRTEEVLTKYEMAEHMAAAFGLPNNNFVAVCDPPPPSTAAPRPYDCTMQTGRLRALGATNRWSFANGIRQALQAHVKRC